MQQRSYKYNIKKAKDNLFFFSPINSLSSDSSDIYVCGLNLFYSLSVVSTAIVIIYLFIHCSFECGFRHSTE